MLTKIISKTKYPYFERDIAIKEWLTRHPDIEDDDWVAIDDCLCADEKHMILINPSCGLHIDDANKVLDFFKCQFMLFYM